MSAVVYFAKYGVETTITFPVVKRASVDLATTTDWTPAAADAAISKDAGALADTSNTVATVGGSPTRGVYLWKLTLTATELQCKEATIQIIDAATKTIEDQTIKVITYGHASAMLPMDFSDAVRAGLTALPNANAGANGGLATVDANNAVKVQSGTGANQIDLSSGRVVLQGVTHTGAVIPTVTAVTNRVTANADQWAGTTIPAPAVTGVPKVDPTHWLGTALATPDTAGYPKVTIKSGTGTGELSLAAGVGNANLVLWKGSAPDDLSAGLVQALAASVADKSGYEVDVVNDKTGYELSSAGVTGARSIFSGIADSGSTTTLTDSDLSQGGTDHWKGRWLLLTSGNLAGQMALITSFDPGSDTLTFAPALTESVTTHTYEILPAARVDLGQWKGATPNDLIANRVDADAQVSADSSGVTTLLSRLSADRAGYLDNLNVGGLVASAAGVMLILTDTGDILTAIGTPADTSLANDIAAVKADTGGLRTDITTARAENLDNLNAPVDSRATPAQVNAEVLDVFGTDSHAEPGKENLPASTSWGKKIDYLYKFLRNKSDSDGSKVMIYSDDDATIDHEATTAEVAGVVTRGKMVVGS